MQVIKRNGEKKPFEIIKIREQINFSCDELDVNPLELESKISVGIKNNMKTSDIQDFILHTATTLITQDEPDWIKVCGRLATHQLHREVYKNTKVDYSEFDKYLDYAIKNNYYRKDFIKVFTENNIKMLASLINYKDDFKMVLPQLLSLKSKYLLKNTRGTIEYPQFADMTNSMILASIEEEDKLIDTTVDYFELLRDEYISLATPFKANLRLLGGNTGSCFILPVGDSLNHIAKAWDDMSAISKQGGGIGVYLGWLRPGGSSSNNIPKANEITKWTKIINDIAVAVNQRGIRPGAITPALDWWHLDIESFIQMKTETSGDLRDKSFDLYPQVVVDDYFIRAINKDGYVYLFDQHEIKERFNLDIVTTLGKESKKIYKEIEELAEAGKLKNFKKIKAKALWKHFLEVWIEIGDFYISHKDNINLSNYLKQTYIANSVNLCVESWSLTKVPMNWSKEVKDGDVVSSESDGLYHSCLVGDTKVQTENGKMSIHDIVHDVTRGKEINVLSYNQDTNQQEYKPVITGALMKKNAKLIKVSYKGKKLICTYDHRIFTYNRGYVEAQHLKPDDKLELLQQ